MEVVEATEKKPRTRKPRIGEQRETLIAVRCSRSFRAWLDEFIESERSSPSQLLEYGLVELAKLRGFRTPPRR